MVILDTRTISLRNEDPIWPTIWPILMIYNDNDNAAIQTVKSVTYLLFILLYQSSMIWLLTMIQIKIYPEWEFTRVMPRDQLGATGGVWGLAISELSGPVVQTLLWQQHPNTVMIRLSSPVGPLLTLNSLLSVVASAEVATAVYTSDWPLLVFRTARCSRRNIVTSDWIR